MFCTLKICVKHLRVCSGSGDDGTGIDDRITTAYARGRLLKFSFGSNTRRHDITLKCTLRCVQSTTTLITSMHAPHAYVILLPPNKARSYFFFMFECRACSLHFMLTHMSIDLKMFFFHSRHKV